MGRGGLASLVIHFLKSRRSGGWAYGGVLAHCCVLHISDLCLLDAKKEKKKLAGSREANMPSTCSVFHLATRGK